MHGKLIRLNSAAMRARSVSVVESSPWSIFTVPLATGIQGNGLQVKVAMVSIAVVIVAMVMSVMVIIAMVTVVIFMVAMVMVVMQGIFKE